MPAIFFALISYFGWAIGDVFATIASRRIGGYSTTFWYIVFQIPLFGLPALFFLDKLQNLTLTILLLNTALGIIGTIGLIAFYEGLRTGNPSLVGTISSSFAALTVILSIIFLNESVTTNQASAIFVIFFGLILSALDFREFKRGKIVGNVGVVLALVAMFCWAIYFTFIKIPIREIGWAWSSMFALSSLVIVPLFMKIRRIKLTAPTYKGALFSVIANSVLLGIGTLSFYIGIERGLTAIVAPIAGSYPTLFVFLSSIFFKEPITKQQIAGIITTLIGIVLLSVFSV